MGPRRSGHSLYKQPGVNHISAMAQSEGGHHSSKTQTKSSVPDENDGLPLELCEPPLVSYTQTCICWNKDYLII